MTTMTPLSWMPWWTRSTASEHALPTCSNTSRPSSGTTCRCARAGPSGTSPPTSPCSSNVCDVAAFVVHHPRSAAQRHPERDDPRPRRPAGGCAVQPEIIDRIRDDRIPATQRVRDTAETLTDILVHSQDIAIALGLDLTMRPTASTLAATRRWDTRGLLAQRGLPPTPARGLPPHRHRHGLDTRAGTRGRRPPVHSLLLTGRDAALEHLTGEGAEAPALSGLQVRVLAGVPRGLGSDT